MDSFVAGAAAGLVVDFTLYPIDTIKTRLQSRDGFRRAGGFVGVYRGLSAVAIGSVPSGAAFFVGYDLTKRALLGEDDGQSDVTYAGRKQWQLASQATAAVVGETTASCIRVPIEMLKQRLQAGQHRNLRSALVHITHGVTPGVATDTAPTSMRVRGIPNLLSGIPVMLLRDVPFAVIQMLCYEALKVALHTDRRPHYLPLCGALGGATAAFITTPLDLLKTRIMLGQVSSPRAGRPKKLSVVCGALQELLHEVPRPTDRWGPMQRFFRGAVPRVTWISIGGSVFFTTYEVVRRYCSCYRFHEK
ncbi:mitochondrial carrier protein [Trypanosoma equiperdum]|nr:mitochondrial carrier protein [Trypanosoma equiperdum]